MQTTRGSLRITKTPRRGLCATVRKHKSRMQFFGATTTTAQQKALDYCKAQGWQISSRHLA